MPTDNFRVQMTRGTTDQNDAYVGQPGELTLDLDKNEFRVHDGVNVGGKKFGGRPGNVLDGYREGLSAVPEGQYGDYLAKAYGATRGYTTHTFAPEVVDGDICYINLATGLVSPTYAVDSTTGDGTVTSDPSYVPEVLAQYVADVTNNKIHHLDAIGEEIPKRLQDIMFAPVGDAEGALWVSADNPGKLTTMDPLTSHGINSKHLVYRSLEHGVLSSRGLSPRGEINYTASEGEDISLITNYLLRIFKRVGLLIPSGVSCVLERMPIAVPTDKLLYVNIEGRLDVTVRHPMPPYLTSGAWYICAGFTVGNSSIYFNGNGEIHHHVAPGTKLYMSGSQLVVIDAYRAELSTIVFTGHGLDIYQTIGVISTSRGGSNSYIYLAGANFHEERRSPAVANASGPGAYLISQGSWSFSEFAMTLRTTALTITGGFTSMPGQAVFSEALVGTNFAGVLIT